MSSGILIIYPEDASFEPTEEGAERARKLLLELFPDAPELQERRREAPMFVDCGEDRRGVRCPECGRHTPFNWFAEDDPGAAWVQETYDDIEGFEHRSMAENVSMPICGHRVELGRITIEPASGYARYFLDIPDFDRCEAYSEDGLAASDADAIGAALGCKVLSLVARY